METNTIADALATLAANAAFNLEQHYNYIAARRAARLAGLAEPDAPSWADRKAETMELNGHRIHVHMVGNSSRNRRKNLGSVCWYLNNKVVSRATLVECLEASAARRCRSQDLA